MTPDVLVGILHKFSTVIIVGIVLLCLVVLVIVIKYFGSDLADRGSWND